jgi:hypothetical protein
MSSDTATGGHPAVELESVLQLVRGQQVSEPFDHGSACCSTARRWLSAVHAAAGATSPLSGLGWIAEMYPWGPSKWPMSWCNLVEQDKLDCGAQSAVTREVLRANGSAVLGVQLLIRASPTDIGHWGSTWRDDGVAPTWLFERLYYHEAVGLVEGTLTVFDPTRNWKVRSDGRTEDGTVAAIRVSGGDATTVMWGRHELAVGEWIALADSLITS